MAYEVQKLVLFQSAHGVNKDLTLDDLVTVINAASLHPTTSGLFIEVRSDGDPTACAVRLSIAREPHVLADSKTIAEQYAATRADRDAIAACDARIEVAWQADEWDDVIDIVLAIDPDLEALVSGVTWFSSLKELSPMVRASPRHPTPPRT